MKSTQQLTHELEMLIEERRSLTSPDVIKKALELENALNKVDAA